VVDGVSPATAALLGHIVVVANGCRGSRANGSRAGNWAAVRNPGMRAR